jgi:hypothetical protein
VWLRCVARCHGLRLRSSTHLPQSLRCAEKPVNVFCAWHTLHVTRFLLESPLYA